MATGAWHYQQAEWLLEQSSSPSGTAGRRALEPDAHPDVIAAAQAHATLALAAATALSGDGVYGLAPHEYREWDQAAGTPLPVQLPERPE